MSLSFTTSSANTFSFRDGRVARSHHAQPRRTLPPDSPPDTGSHEPECLPMHGVHCSPQKPARRWKPINIVIILAATFCLLPCSASAHFMEDFQESNCSKYDPEKNLHNAGEQGNCLASLRDPVYREEFNVCKSNICFLLTLDPPLFTFNQESVDAGENRNRMKLPFRCKNSKETHRSVGGFALDILKKTSAADEYCVWVGPLASCTWNALVDFAAVMGDQHGYQFAVVGPMLETPLRKCRHYASTSWWDDRLVILGRNVRENKTDAHPIWQLVKPFESYTWVVVGAVLALFLIVCLIILYRFHVFRGKSAIAAITAFFVIIGDRTAALATSRLAQNRGKETQPVRTKKIISNDLTELSFQSATSDGDLSLQIETNDSVTDEQIIQNDTFLTKFSLSTSLFRVALIAFVAMFSLFYEVAVVNFLFQQQNIQLTKEIEHLTVSELQQYCIMQHTAMEAIWNFRVNPRGSKFDEQDESQIPWKRGHSANECLSLVLDDDSPIQFFVTYELEGTYLIESRASCESVTIFETKESIHHFNSGWLFNDKVPAEKRRQLDRELGALKILGALSDLDGGKGELCRPTLLSSITFGIILLPVAFLVLPPLICSAIVAIFWRKINSKIDGPLEGAP